MYFDLDDVFGVVNFEAKIDGYGNVDCIFPNSETESSFMGLEFWKRASCSGKRDFDQSPRPDWVITSHTFLERSVILQAGQFYCQSPKIEMRVMEWIQDSKLGLHRLRDTVP